MSVSTNEPLLTKKLCPNLMMSAVPQTDQGGIYRGALQSIWIRTSSPLCKELRQQLADVGVDLTQSNPAYSQGSSFVYTADLKQGANLKSLLALRTVLQVRGSESLTLLQGQSPARAALEDLKVASAAPLRFIENLNAAGVAQKAQRILLGAIESFELDDDGGDETRASYKTLLADSISNAIQKASHLGRGGIPERATSTRILADIMTEDASAISTEAEDRVSYCLARDLYELAEQLRAISS